MPNMPKTINLFGRVRLVVDGAVVDRFPTQKVAALLAYLALHPNWQGREKIAEEIWSDQPEGKGLASLRNALSVLRRILEPAGVGSPSALESTRTHCRLSRALCGCDVWEFEEAVLRRDFDLAVELYSDDLLPDVYDAWLDSLRESYRRSFLIAIAHVAESALPKDPVRALEFADRWRKCDAFDVEAERVFVLAQAATGRRGSAISELNRFVEEYQVEFGCEPLLDLPALRAQLNEAVKPAPASRVLSSEKEPSERRDRYLPLYLTQFFGRERELADLIEWASGPSRLLTVVGMGGIGKTRLAIEAGRSLANLGSDVYFVGLAAAEDEAALIAALVRAFELRESDTDSPKQVLLTRLGQLEKPTILILDNLEQVVGSAAQLVLELLPSSEHLKLLCTSRELLGIEGERLLTLKAFVLPEDISGSNPGELIEKHVALKMFVDRARSTKADFALTARNYQDVATLCYELEGLPLAIELMAGWVGTWPISVMREKVKDGGVLARKLGHDHRHRSLEACIEWSFKLLEPPVRLFLCELSLFRGGWTLDAAEAVTGDDNAAEVIAKLVDRSLVLSTEVEDELRFSMVESVRDYCMSRFHPNPSDGLGDRFVSYFTRLVQSKTNPCAGREERANHRRLDRERENIEVVALLCEEGLASVDDGLALVGALELHWVYRGAWNAGIGLIDRLLALPTQGPCGPGRIVALQSLSVLVQETGDFARSERIFQQLAALAEERNDAVARFRALTQMGNILSRQGKFGAAIEPHQKALEIALSANNSRLVAVARCNLAEAMFGLDQVDGAVEHWLIAEELDHSNGNAAGEATLFLAFANAWAGHASQASRRLQVYLHKLHGIGFARGYVRAVHFTALVAIRANDVPIAQQLVLSSRAFLTREGLLYDALEVKCAGMIDQALTAVVSSGVAEKVNALDLEEAVSLANQFLTRTIEASGAA